MQFRIINKTVLSNCKAYLDSLPLDGSYEVVVRKYARKRRNEANSLYHVRLKEISNQAWLNGRQYSSEVWHEYFKAQFLPEEYQEGITLDGYEKYAILPDGSRQIIGSTTKLTTTGSANYLTQVDGHHLLRVVLHRDHLQPG